MLHLIETGPGPDDPSLGERVQVAAPGEPAAKVAGFHGALAADGARVLVRLTPLTPARRGEEVQAASLREAFGLPAGEPWRLEVELHPDEQGGGPALLSAGLVVADGAGPALRPLIELAAPPAGAAAPPFRTLYTPPVRLEPGQRAQLALWGHAPGDTGGAARVRFATAAGGTLEVPLTGSDLEVDSLPGWFARAEGAPAGSDGGTEHVAAAPEAEAAPILPQAPGAALGPSSGTSPESPAADPHERNGSSGDGSADGPRADPESGTASGADAASAAAPDPRDAEIARLRARVDQLEARRQERELQWIDYNRALASLDLDQLVGTFPIDPEYQPEDVPLPGPGDPPLGSQVDAAKSRDRAQEIARAFNARLQLEGVRGYELLEPGTLDSGAIGPVVFRLLDDRGLLVGSLYADHLRLEGSRAARTLTIVLEQGTESRGGQRTPFENGERRILLPMVDPIPWMQEMPELFRARDLSPPGDDGLWDVERVRRDLNALLAEDSAAGWYRVQGMTGVVGDTLTDVHLESFDASGRLDRRFFADRMRISVENDGVVLMLEGGAVVRGEDKRSFVGGVHRLFLPRARPDEWRSAALPGLAPAPERAPRIPAAPNAAAAGG